MSKEVICDAGVFNRELSKKRKPFCAMLLHTFVRNSALYVQIFNSMPNFAFLTKW